MIVSAPMAPLLDGAGSASSSDGSSVVSGTYALINNAPYGHEGTLEESSMEALRQQFEVNVFGAVAMMKAVLPYMRQRRNGRVINVTSMGAV